MPRRPEPGLVELFLAFSGIAIIGFGGVLPWARRMLVEQRQWLTGDEFVEALSLAQFLPGGNIINLSVAVGMRFRGAAGSIAATSGLLVGPFIIVIALGALYLHYGQVPAIHGGLAGIAAAASGLIISMAMKMAEPLLRRRLIVPIVFTAAAFVAIGLLRLPMLAVLLVLSPLSIAYAWTRLP